MSVKTEVIEGTIATFASDMRLLINNKEFSDVKFLIGPGRKAVCAHKCILSARCEVFRAMFNDQQHRHKDRDAPLVLSDTKPDTFLTMLEYIYTNCATLKYKTATDVLGIGIEYGLDGLRSLCTSFLISNLCAESVCHIIQTAGIYGLDELKQKAMLCVQKNTKKVFSSSSFHEMSASALAEVLRSDDLDMDEIDILTAVRNWANANSAAADQPVDVVAKPVVVHIRLPLLSPEELQTVEAENKSDKLIPVDALSYAWKCHALKMVEKDNPLTTRRKGTIARESHKYMQIL